MQKLEHKAYEEWHFQKDINNYQISAWHLLRIQRELIMAILRLALSITCLSAAVTLAIGVPFITSIAIVSLVAITIIISV